jgi:hypothetical protein
MQDDLFEPVAVDTLVERLRREGGDAFRQHYSLGMWRLCAEAADRIEEMERRIAALCGEE